MSPSQMTASSSCYMVLRQTRFVRGRIQSRYHNLAIPYAQFELCIISYCSSRSSCRGATVFIPRLCLFNLRSLTSRLYSLLRAAGVDVMPYAGHSFRTGAATTINSCWWSASVAYSCRHCMGSWYSDCYRRYVHNHPLYSPESFCLTGIHPCSRWSSLTSTIPM